MEPVITQKSTRAHFEEKRSKREQDRKLTPTADECKIRAQQNNSKKKPKKYILKTRTGVACMINVV
jgi:hypothetical protein